MIGKSELQAVEEATKSRWKACLALVTAFRYPGLVTELTGGVAVGGSALEDASTPSVVILGNGSEAANLCAALQQQGIKVGMAGRLKEAAALTEKHGVRLVVVDEALMDSSSAGWELRQHKILPIVLLGSSHDKEGWERAFELEADAYVSKSMGLGEQVSRVRAILRRY